MDLVQNMPKIIYGPDACYEIDQEALSQRRYARLWMVFSLILSDVFSLTFAFGLAFVIHSLWHRSEPFTLVVNQNFIFLIPVFIFLYTFSGLYPAVGLSPIDELRVLAKTIFSIFLWFTPFLFLSTLFADFPLDTWFLACPVVLLSTQLDRWILRILSRRAKLWGEPVMVIGTGPETQYIEKYLEFSGRLGLRPVFRVTGDYIPDEQFAEIVKKTGIRKAILVVSEMSAELKKCIIDQRQFPFSQLIVIPSLDWGYSLGVTTLDLEGVLGLGVHQNLLNRWAYLTKRILDIVIVFIGSVFIIPFGFIIALLIRLDSPGKVIYTQDRIGKNGKVFRIFKFRTMVLNAEQHLQDYLTANPDLKTEWDSSQKLRYDPRVTRVGKILRRLSLDELPQIWNVLLGEMSIVGPRPIPINESSRYHDGMDLYKMVRPGITGMWQVSGRSECSYEERAHYNEYYIRNWSIWLDIYVLLRTVWVVLSQQGAY